VSCSQRRQQASFNRITVDGDTSTNDAVTLSATGQSGIEVTAGSEQAEHFAQSLTTLMIELGAGHCA
jgi:glutamate N-acetyltransferase/amino-acid N-acetyltransferase